jgi:hypothetical protein
VPHNEKVKVRFTLDDSCWHGTASEALWADAVGELRRIDNLPFLASGISFADIVKTKRNTDGIEDFISVAKRGGHSTYRLMILRRHIPHDRLQRIAEIGCLYEVGKIGDVLLVSVSVPPTANINTAYSEFKAGEADGIWDFEEANFEHSI